VRTKLARGGRRILQLLALLPIILPAFLTLARATPAIAGTDDYPAVWRNAAPDTLVDSWGEFNRECTSFAAFRLSSRNGFTMPFHDNAKNWGPDASSRGYPVDMKPAVGSIAWWSSGHIAWVEAVNGSNVTIEEYNFNFTHNYSERTIAASSVSGYIHFKDLSNSTTLLVIRTGGTLYGKVNLTDPWVKLTTGAADVRVSASRITYTDTSGNIWAKDGLNGTWAEEYGPADQYSASG
jgi:surface antigen